MNRVLSALIVIFTVLNSGTTFGQQIEWMHDLEAAQKVATEQDKLILLHFSAEWCRPCKQLETFVFSSSMVAKAINEKLVPVHIDTDNHPELVKQFSIEEIPTDIVLTAKGRVVTKRKSPKDSTNYMRMVKSLPVATTANELQNEEMTQKIERVVSANKKKLINPNQNDFMASKPSHQQPAPSKSSMQLAEKSQTRQVDHESKSFAPRQSAFAHSPGIGPQRVINDQFFVEKSATDNAANGNDESMANSGSFVPQKPSMQLQPRPTSTPLASAKIENPFHSEQATDFNNNSSAARIMAPDFGNEDKSVAKSIQNFQPKAKSSNQSLVPQLSAKFENRDEDRTSMMLKPNVTMPANSQADSKSRAKVMPEFALGGRCPVTLLRDGKWMKGDSGLGCVHRGRVYIFGDADKLMLFKSDPDKYSPVLAGYDPVKFHETGNLVDGAEEHGVFMGKTGDQKIVLFSSKETRARFQSNPQKYMSTIRTAVQSTGKMR